MGWNGLKLNLQKSRQRGKEDENEVFHYQQDRHNWRRSNYRGTGPITLEGWVIPGRGDGFVASNSQFSGVQIGKWDGGYWVFAVRNENGYIKTRSKKPAVVGKKVHIAGVFDGRTVRLYVDGELQEVVAFKGKHKPSDNALLIGADTDGNGAPESCFSGTMCNMFRISNSVRYTRSFEPEADFVPDNNTVALYDMSAKPENGKQIKDLSGNKRHGLIKRAEHVKLDLK